MTFSHDYQRRCGGSSLREDGEGLPQGGRRLGRVGPHVRRRHGVARNLPRLPRLPVQHDAGHLFRAAQQPHADRSGLLAIHLRLRAVRHGGPRRADGRSSRSPSRAASTGARTSRIAASSIRSTSASTTTTRSTPAGAHRWPTSPAPTTSKSGYSRHVHRSAQRTRAEPHAAALHLQRERARERRVSGRRRAASVPGVGLVLPGAALGPARQHADARVLAQDQWTLGRLTLQGGIRYDRAWSWAPAEGNGTTETSRFNPAPISFERTVSVRGYNDITPRFGVAYDLFGNGKTALKVNGGKYLEAATGDVIYSSNNPAARIVTRIGSGAGTRRAAGPTGTAISSSTAICCSPAAQDNLATGGDLCAARRRRRPELRQRQSRHDDGQPRHPRRVGRASLRLAVRRVGAARADAAAVGRGGVQPPVVGQLLRHRQRR